MFRGFGNLKESTSRMRPEFVTSPPNSMAAHLCSSCRSAMSFYRFETGDTTAYPSHHEGMTLTLSLCQDEEIGCPADTFW